jgi:hypothetical protein
MIETSFNCFLRIFILAEVPKAIPWLPEVSTSRYFQLKWEEGE